MLVLFKHKIFSVKNYILFLISILVVSIQANSQTANQAYETEGNLKKHIFFLSDDKLEGRRAGTAGEKKAAAYIADYFKLNGIRPYGTSGYLQAFEIKEGKKMGANNALSFNGQKLLIEKDYFVFPYSANGKWEVLGKDVSYIDLAKQDTKGTNPHFDLLLSIKGLADDAVAKGAKAIVLYNSSTEAEDIHFNKRDKTPTAGIPIVYVNKSAASQLFSSGATPSMNLQTQVEEGYRTGNNVVGFIDNKAPQTVILGAHFDHLGYGEDGNSMLRTGEKLIHNGADDNASGTAALLELSRLLKSSPAKNNNYLFIAFSAEELGLFGSKHFVENPTIDLKKVNYMINMDMVGRLNDSSKALTIGGFGTSPEWATVIKAGPSDNFYIKIDSSGSGPSDHTSFYRKDIPVLFYFTGLHHDYHKPSDDFDKINYKGATQIVQHVLNTIESLNAAPKLGFLKTREQQVSTTSFRVTLGIMPDYTYTGDGVKADGVTEGRPGAKAGIKAGDIIVQLGEHKINDMDSYMKALNKFKKGDTTTVKFKRGNELKEESVTF